MRARRPIAISCSALLVSALPLLRDWSSLRINWTTSLPVGVYETERLDLRRGATVLVCLPPAIARDGLDRGYLPRGSCASDASPVGKVVAAIAGDEIELGESSLVVNGVRVSANAIRSADSSGRPLPHSPFGRRVVGTDEIWLVGVDERSWDSRYFGPVPRSAVLASLRPLATFTLSAP
jgi:conjugative transfer signal peptidase TraF